MAGVPRASYYKWLKQKPSLRQLENEELTTVMMSIYEKVEGIVGYRQLTLHIRRENQKTSYLSLQI
jgi:putative transposase